MTLLPPNQRTGLLLSFGLGTSLLAVAPSAIAATALPRLTPPARISRWYCPPMRSMPIYVSVKVMQALFRRLKKALSVPSLPT